RRKQAPQAARGLRSRAPKKRRASIEGRRKTVPRIAGVDLPNEKRLEIALTYIYGIGPSPASRILKKTGINPDVRAKNLSVADTGRLRQVIENEYKVEGALRGEIAMSVK